MAIVDQKWSALPVPYAMEFPDRVPKERYFDPDFYAMEVEQLWPRGLADGVPARGDPRAARLRRVRVPRPVDHRAAHRRHGRQRVPERLPPSWREGRPGPRDVRERVPAARSTVGATAPDGKNTYVTQRRTFAEHNLQPDDIDLVPVRCEVWGGCAWINFDGDAPPLRQCIEPFATIARRVEGGVAADRAVVRVPSPGELEARHRGVRGDVPRGGDAPAARHPGEVRAARRCAVRPAARSSTRRSTTCAR